MRFTQLLRQTQRVLVRAPHTAPPTGLTGIRQHPDPRPALLALYEATLVELEDIPASAVYRQATEALTKARMAVVEKEEVVAKIEQQIGCGLIEEVIIQADEELQLVKQMKDWKVWEEAK